MKNAIKIGLNTWAIIAMIVGFFIFLGLAEDPGSMLWFFILYFVILMAFVSWGLFRVWKQRRKEREADLLRRVRQTLESPSFSDKPSPESILYLRPFQIDEQYMNEVEYAGRRFTSFESLVCQMVREGGKPIAIGKPGENLQPLGAQRIYATDETWQAKVTEYFKVSKYVILYADFTPGVKWEIENAVNFYRDKLILIPKTYNRYGSFLQKISTTDLWLLFAPIYGLWVNRFFFKKAHRGGKYYRNWNKLLKKYMPGFKMNDTVSAVIFEGGRAIPFYAAKPTQEAQFRAIHRAIHAKLRVPTRPALYLYKGAKPLLSLCADLGFKNITSATVYPLAMGRVEFYDRGLRYCSASSMSRINRSLREENTFQKNYKSNQLIPYSSIRRVDQLGENLLQLVLDEANGSMYLFVPKYHRECIPTLKILLEQSSRRGYFTPDNGFLAHCRDKQESDYAKGLVVMEVFGLLLGGVLLLLSLLGVEAAYYLLFVGYGYWNLLAALLSYWLSYVSQKEFARIFGTVMLGIHVCLALHGFSMIL